MVTLRNKSKSGGLSSQLVPLGLLASLLSLKSKKKRRSYRKGMPSKTRKGRLDFITRKGSKFYNRRNKRQFRNVLRTRRRPFQ